MSDSVDYGLVEEIFLEALELDPSARAELLAARCGSDPAVRAEVESLLEAHEGTGLVPEIEEERPFGGRYPERLGDYRIVRPLGEGGMGVVFLAIREGEGFEQTVALKLLRGILRDPLIARRFEEERRILARLEHPAIARFVDGGVTGEGEPYYAMEYVQGEDILTHCDERRLRIEERLRLFADVCDAVHHAHHQLVVHRDIKPSNIMVTPEGRPKLLDFGIAKSMEDLTSSEVTSKWLTTAYASPEQVSGGPVTTHSDVYALGVLLCELLSGSRPIDTDRGSLEQVTRAILHETPARPSALAGEGPRDTDPARQDRIAARRGTTPHRLARALRGDLDMIVAKALSKEPDRRYDSARDLGDDVRRFLEGRPVLARPESVTYRVRKFGRRHRPLVTAAALLAVSLVGGTLAVAWQARVATAERDRAEIEAERARQVTRLMTDIFRLSDPTTTVGDTVGVQQVLREGVTRVEETLADDPILQATLLLELAKIHRNLGLLGDAERLVGRAASLRETQAPGTLAHAEALGLQGLILVDAGRVNRAITVLERALELRDDLLPAGDTITASLLTSLGWEIRSLGQFERARGMFERALEIRRSSLGSDHPAVANSMLGLASTYHDQGHFDEAEKIFRTALGSAELEPSPVTGAALVNLGMMSRLRERYAESEPLLREGFEMTQTLFGRQHPTTLEAAEQLGVALTALGHFEEAEPLLSDNLAIAVRTLGEAHEQTRGAREALATLDHDMGRFGLAAARHDSVVAAKSLARGGDHPGVVYSLVAAGDAFLDGGEPATAEDRYREGLAMSNRLGNDGGVYEMLARHGLARAALVRGDGEQADSLLRIASAIAEGTLRPTHRYVLDLERTRARLLLSRGRTGEASRILTDVLAAEREIRPSPHPRIGRTLALLAEALQAEGAVDAAAERRREALNQLRALPADHPERRRLQAEPRTSDGGATTTGRPPASWSSVPHEPSAGIPDALGSRMPSPATHVREPVGPRPAPLRVSSP